MPSRVEIWSLVDPAAGSPFNVDVTITGAGHLGATIGVMTLQRCPSGPMEDSPVTRVIPTGSATITSRPGELVFGVIAIKHSWRCRLHSRRGYEQWDLRQDKANGSGLTIGGASPNVNASWSIDTSNKWAAAGVSIKPLGRVPVPWLCGGKWHDHT